MTSAARAPARRLLLLLAAAAALADAFRIAQFADLHYGEDENGAWGPQQDANSTRVMRAVLAAEAAAAHRATAASLDLVVFSGDMVTGNNVGANATAYLGMAMRQTAAAGVPFASIYGNHDDAPLDDRTASAAGGVGSGTQSTTTRRELLAWETAAFPALSRTCAAEPGVSAEQCPESLAPSVSNYFLLVREGDAAAGGGGSASAPVAVLYFLDSGGGSFYDMARNNGGCARGAVWARPAERHLCAHPIARVCDGGGLAKVRRHGRRRHHAYGGRQRALCDACGDGRGARSLCRARPRQRVVLSAQRRAALLRTAHGLRRLRHMVTRRAHH